ncbi:hypothetical protein [Streptomyces fuscichromogenes]|uniref:Uncharacterized protein n=1 Tax=Streptomyces fuscichromogenes TaxID=1324013 RepID=A0A917XG40_9ACTN|nr:hypothetical protein [Streptomyces fuscichromogenes]GGN19548.1 hypothetical protein GCM10011578_049520 [Streptomyces fuscichromogenes]
MSLSVLMVEMAQCQVLTGPGERDPAEEFAGDGIGVGERVGGRLPQELIDAAGAYPVGDEGGPVGAGGMA